MNVLKNVFNGVACGALFVSAFFWSLIFVFVNPGVSFLPAVLVCALLTNVLTGVLLAADCRRHILYRSLIALPAGAVTFFIYRQIHFVFYWINQIWPGYGNLSAGGGFCALVCFVVFCLCVPAAAAVAVSMTPKTRNRRTAGPGKDATFFHDRLS